MSRFDDLQKAAVSGNSKIDNGDPMLDGLKFETIKATIVSKASTEIVVKPADGTDNVVTFYCDHDGDGMFYHLHSLEVGTEIELKRAFAEGE